jgi:hypothetical protein
MKALWALSCVFVVSGFAHSETPLPAKELMAKAQAQAAKQHKSVFVMFDASW